MGKLSSSSRPVDYTSKIAQRPVLPVPFWSFLHRDLIGKVEGLVLLGSFSILLSLWFDKYILHFWSYL